ncbi:EamA/RhaT family transporter [Streptomyces kunmingensis]|uniref:EamA/RhaT family transporter n=1 Tax=Streptomyces kunmingensis TaxID=68225 RepID=A0ABU6CBA1_9ACTN|nr:EamA/RhaT family transporter [Streptomyces kunmingensis]MEB3961987.1 EamA/RhaT family transporter [Streptomyces kunmingensis]
MSDETGTGTPSTSPAPGPRPEEIRFFGTSWVDHSGGYALRRAAVGVGALLAAVAGCFVLRFAYQGLAIADVGAFVNVLVVVMFAICSAFAFNRTWSGFSQRPDPERQASLRGFLTIGFVGVLAAHALRCLTEAPGEKLRRQEYETAREQFERRTTRRTRNPSKKAPGKSGKKRA